MTRLRPQYTQYITTGCTGSARTQGPRIAEMWRYAEVGKPVALVCTHGEELGKTWRHGKRWMIGQGGLGKKKRRRDFTRSIWGRRFSLILACVYFLTLYLFCAFGWGGPVAALWRRHTLIRGRTGRGCGGGTGYSFRYFLGLESRMFM